MCHKIAWYHALCYHQNPAYNIAMFCKKAVKVGYECHNPECMIFPMFGACVLCKHPEDISTRNYSPARRYADDSLSPPYTPDSFSDALIDEELEPEDFIGDDSGIYLDDGDGAAYVDENDLDAELELFDMITF